MREIRHFSKMSHLPCHMKRCGISVRVFWRVVDFAGTVALQDPPTSLCPYFNLWGHFKGCMYNNNPCSTEGSKTNTEEEI